MPTNLFENTAYSFNQPLSTIFPEPIISKRAPTTLDKAPIGQLWIYTTANTPYILTSIINNAATWVNTTGGAGTFTSLTVTPGPVSLTGTTNINTTGAAVTTIGTGGTGAVHIGNATGNTAVTGSLSTTTSLAATTSVSAGTTVTAGTGLTVTLGNATLTNGNVVFSAAGTGIMLPGPTQIINGAGAPAGGLAINVGDMYVNTTAATAATRLYIATAAGMWTNVTCAS